MKSINSYAHGASWNAKFFAPLLQGKSLAMKRYEAVRSLVIPLLFRRRPAAVARLVVAIIVNSVNGMFWTRRVSHIGIEVFKGLPAFANRYAACAIFIEIPVSGIIATIFHIRPSSTYLGVGHAVTCFSFRCSLSLKASATLSMAAHKFLASDRKVIAARALGVPQCSIIGAFPSKAYDGKPSESLPNQVFESSAALYSMTFSHFDLLSRSVVRAVRECQFLGGSFSMWDSTVICK